MINHQEAIKRMESVREYLCAGNPIWNVDEMREVFDMAISALQAQDSPKPKAESAQNVPKEDLISRKVAIDALMEIMDRPNHAEFLYTDEICKTLNELPSAQPEQTEIIRCKDCNKASKCYGDVIMRSRGGGNIYCPLEFCSEAERRTDE